MNISFIGGGNMATAIIGGLIKQSFSPLQISVVEVDASRRQSLIEEFGVTVTGNFSDGIQYSEIVVLAVKPQQLHDVSIHVAGLLRDKLIISIAAGIRTNTLSKWFDGHQCIVRAMPNTPALIGKGVTGLYALPSVNAQQKEQTTNILNSIGLAFWVSEEALLDAVTALSGSGPAYVFYFLEIMQEAGVTLGLSSELARQLAIQTFLGATHLAADSNEAIATLRTRVTSKGGTTEQALLSLAQDDVKQSFIRAIRASYERSKQMGDEFGRDN